MKRSTAVFAGAALALSTVIGLTGVAVAADDPSCGSKLQLLADARAEFNTSVALGETRARELGLSEGAIAYVRAALAGGVSAGEKATILAVHLPAVLASGGGSEADLELAVRVEAAANALANAERNAEGCDVPPANEEDLDCSDFADDAAAQAKLDEDESDPHNLDTDGDGIACEDNVDLDEPDSSGDDDVVPSDLSNGVATGVA